MANKLLPDISKQYKPIIERWILRTLLDLRGYSMMNMRYGVDEYDNVLSFIGLGYLVEKN